MGFVWVIRVDIRFGFCIGVRESFSEVFRGRGRSELVFLFC